MFRRTVIESPIGEIPMYCRKVPGDREVMGEVIMRDRYGIESLDNKGVSPDLVIDVGANIGSFSALALKYWSQAEVMAFEPHPLSFGLLNQNMRGYEGSTTLNLSAVVGRDLPNSFLQISSEAATDFPQCWDLNQSSKKEIPDPMSQGFCHCNTVHINDILRPLAGKKTLLKLDCEGSEFYIIDGISEENLKKVDVLLMEIHGSQINIPNYLDASWAAFREKILKHFDCPEIEKRKTIGQDQFIATAIRKNS